MKRIIIIFFILASIKSFSQKNMIEDNLIIFNYSHQFPLGEISEIFGDNSSMGIIYLRNNRLLYGLDVNFMFGNNVRNDSLLKSISTEDGYLINSSGELDQVLFYQRGINAHIIIGKSFNSEEKNSSGVYLYGGIGYLQHKIQLESNRTNLPQIDQNYIKGYDNLTRGLSTKICIDYMYFSKKTFLKFVVGIEFINAITRKERVYNFVDMNYNASNLQLDQFLGIKTGVIIPINRMNQGNFHYR